MKAEEIKVNPEVCKDVFHEAAVIIEDEWGCSGLSGDFYEEYAREVLNKYIELKLKL